MASAPATAFCLIRSEGMGDMLLALGAAKALKRLRGALVFIGTNPQHVALARACPHVDEVFTNNDEFQAIVARHPDVQLTVAQLDRASFGIAARHQTDAYLDELGISAAPDEKNIELRADAAKLVQKDGATTHRWGVMIPSTGYAYWMFGALTKQNGQPLMNPAGKIGRAHV